MRLFNVLWFHQCLGHKQGIPHNVSSSYGPCLFCYCSHLPLLQSPIVPFQKPSKWNNCKSAFSEGSLQGNKGETFFARLSVQNLTGSRRHLIVRMHGKQGKAATQGQQRGDGDDHGREGASGGRGEGETN